MWEALLDHLTETVQIIGYVAGVLMVIIGTGAVLGLFLHAIVN